MTKFWNDDYSRILLVPFALLMLLKTVPFSLLPFCSVIIQYWISSSILSSFSWLNFPCLYNGSNNTYVTAVLWGFHEMTLKQTAQCVGGVSFSAQEIETAIHCLPPHPNHKEPLQLYVMIMVCRWYIFCGTITLCIYRFIHQILHEL